MLKANQMFYIVFMIIQFKHFHDSLNIELTLALGCEFLSAKFVQFPLTFA